ncbi:MAG TPA: hypothetical protein VGP82_06480 [Ktedonobacterales bacterium]|nr:hypothetical protein [Ktedonobacterales bacterium]
MQNGRRGDPADVRSARDGRYNLFADVTQVPDRSSRRTTDGA